MPLEGLEGPVAVVLRGPRMAEVVANPSPAHLLPRPEACPRSRTAGPLETGAPATAKEAKAGVDAVVPLASVTLPAVDAAASAARPVLLGPTVVLPKSTSLAFGAPTTEPSAVRDSAPSRSIDDGPYLDFRPARFSRTSPA